MYSLINERPRIVLPISLLALLIPVALIEYQVTRHTGGTLMYPLDDTFIHLTIAKNLALHGNWGITSGEFQSASSSLLYTLLLAILIKIFTVQVWIPLVVNILAGIILIIVIWKQLQKENVGPFGQLIILLAVIFFTPLPILVISGMEHTLQCLFTFLFIFRFSDWLEQIDNEAGKNNLPVPLLLYGIFCSTIRYEGLFLIAIACLLLLYKRKIGAAFLLGFVCVLPVALFGIYSVGKGSFFLPNSVLIKSEMATPFICGHLPFRFLCYTQEANRGLRRAQRNSNPVSSDHPATLLSFFRRLFQKGCSLQVYIYPADLLYFPAIVFGLYRLVFPL